MKQSRHRKILEIIANRLVTTQEELQKLLAEEGFQTTQATISRDIKELRLIKTLSATGEYYYTTQQENFDVAMPVNISAIFLESIKNVDCAGNFVVVKCFSGMANAVCATIDNGKWDGLVGTIAGDDTIFMLLRTENDAVTFASYLAEIIHKSRK